MTITFIMFFSLNSWININASDAILEWVYNGVPVGSLFKIEPTAYYCDNYKFNEKEKHFVDKQIKLLLQKGCIKTCDYA